MTILGIHGKYHDLRRIENYEHCTLFLLLWSYLGEWALDCVQISSLGITWKIPSFVLLD